MRKDHRKYIAIGDYLGLVGVFFVMVGRWAYTGDASRWAFLYVNRYSHLQAGDRRCLWLGGAIVSGAMTMHGQSKAMWTEAGMQEGNRE
ncbi:hypothetical protein D5086_026584 [Populus alba]|uniref:Uncharacterized protein n=1 Tax=Populus alba TaxID=43335 RepID=A0ACC4B2X4_POPAL